MATINHLTDLILNIENFHAGISQPSLVKKEEINAMDGQVAHLAVPTEKVAFHDSDSDVANLSNFHAGETNFHAGIGSNFHAGNFHAGKGNFHAGGSNNFHSGNFHAGDDNFHAGSPYVGNFHAGEKDIHASLDSNLHSGKSHADKPHAGENNFHAGETNFHAGEDNFHAGGTNFHASNFHAGETNYHAGNFHAGKDNFHAGENNFHARETNFHAGEDNFHAGETNFHAGETNYHAGKDNFHAGNFHAGKDNFHAGETNFHAGENNFHAGGTNFHASDFHAGETNYHAGKDNFHAGEKNFHAGKEQNLDARERNFHAGQNLDTVYVADTGVDAQRTITSSVRFFSNLTSNETPFNYVERPADGRFNNLQSHEHQIRVHDIADCPTMFDTSREAFACLPRSLPAQGRYNWKDDDDIKLNLYPKITSLLMSKLGARKVLLFDHTIRVKGGNRAPVTQAHIDQTPASAVSRVWRHLPPSEAMNTKDRVRLINVWLPINGKVERDPLAFVDSSTLRDEDLVAVEHRYPTWTGETYVVKYDSEQKWYVWGGMEDGDALLLCCYDSETGARCAHAAINDPRSPTGAKTRESIEVRALVFG